MRAWIVLWGVLAFSVSLGCQLQLGTQTAQLGQQSKDTSSPIKVEVSQANKPTTLVDVAGNLAWPIFAFVALLLLHKPLGQFLTDIGKRASEISVGVLSLKLPIVSEVHVEQDVATFKAMEGAQLANDSAKNTLFKEFRAAGYRQFLVIRLGSGQEWLTSRLFIFALMLQRMKGIRAIVFVDSAGGSDLHFVGVATPESVRSGLGKRQPWLEAAFAFAYADATGGFILPPPGSVLINDSSGALSPDLSEDVVRKFVGRLLWQGAGGSGVDPEWTKLGNTFEHATWLDTSTLRGMLGDNLSSESINAECDDRNKVKLLLRKRYPYVAALDGKGSFQSLVDRGRLLQDVSEHVG